MAKNDSTPENSRRIIQDEVGKGVKRIADQVTGPLTTFLPSLVSSIPAGGAMLKIVKHLARPVEPPVVNVEGGDKKGGSLSASEVEKANSEKRAGERQTTLLEKIAGGIGDMAKGFLKAAASKGAFGLGALAGLIGGPVIILVNFFKALGGQVKFLNTLTGGRLAKMFAPIVRFFDAIDDIVKKGGTSKFLKGGTFKMFGRFTGTLSRLVGNIKKIIKPIVSAAKSSASFIKGFAKTAKFFAGFGRILGRLFLPVTIFMAVWDGITGFLDGFTDSDGKSLLTKVLDGIGEGLGKIVGNLIGFPLNLIKDGVAWIGTKLGFNMTFMKDLDFKKIIKDIVSLPWNMLSKAIDWVGTLFTDPAAALTKLWTALVGEGGLIDIIFGPIDKGIAWVKGLFGWSTEGQEEFSIATFIKGVFTSIKTWLGTLFKFDSTSSIIASIVNVLTFIPNILKDLITGATGWLLGLFGFGDAAKKLANATDWSFGSLITDAFTAVKDWFVGLFAWGKDTGTNTQGDFSFLTLISGVFTSVKKWFTGLFSWNSEGKNEEGFSIMGAVTDAFKSAVKWVKSIFSWGEKGPTVKGGISKFIDIVLAPYNLAINWLMGLFGWSKPDGEPFSIGKLVTDAITKIFDWFKGLLNFDFKGLLAKIPGAGTVMKFFDKDEELKAAEESGLYDKDLVGASEIDKQKATTAPLDQLKAILADDDLRKKDKAYIEKLVADRSSALDAANAALKEAEEEKLAAAANNIIMQDNSTTLNGGGQSRSPTFVPLSDYSNQWNTAIP